MIDKTNVQHNVCHCRQPVKLCSYEPAVVASLLKLFLRELPEPVLTSRLAGSWEEVAQARVYTDRRDGMLRQEIVFCSKVKCEIDP